MRVKKYVLGKHMIRLIYCLQLVSIFLPIGNGYYGHGQLLAHAHSPIRMRLKISDEPILNLNFYQLVFSLFLFSVTRFIIRARP